MTIGEKIKLIRREKKITQKRLSELSGISVTSIQYYECGKFSPKIEQVEKIASALEVTPFDLIGFDYWDETANTEQLSKEVSALDSVSSAYGEAAVQLLSDFLSLNEQGQRKAADYLTDLTENPKYQK